MATLTAQAVMARTTCDDHPLLVNVAASDDFSPAVRRVGRSASGESPGGPALVEAQVASAPATVAAQVDGQAGRRGLPSVDA